MTTQEVSYPFHLEKVSGRAPLLIRNIAKVENGPFTVNSTFFSTPIFSLDLMPPVGVTVCDST